MNEDSSFDVFADDLLETTRHFGVKPRSLSASYFPLVKVFAVHRSAIDFADSISLISVVASMGRLAREGTSVLKFMRQILKFLKPDQTSNLTFKASFFWEVVSLSTSSGSSTGTFELCVGVRYLQDMQ